MEAVVLKDQTRLEGLIQGQTDAEIDFAQILQPPGKPMYAVIRGISRSGVARFERLPYAEHEQLAERFATFRNRAVIEAGRMEEVALHEESGDSGRELVYQGSWFELRSTADNEQTRRCVVRIEQIFRAFRTVLPPRVDGSRKLNVRVFGSLDQYRSRLRRLDLDLSNVAFYSARERTILAGSDLNVFAQRLAQVRAEHERVKKEYSRLDDEYARSLAALNEQLKTAGFTPAEIAAEIRLRKAAWKEEMESALAANLEHQRANEQKFADVTSAMFAQLYHEAFHAYLDAFVYPQGEHHVPRWLNEGLAQVFESGQLEGDSLRIDAADPVKLARLKEELRSGNRLPLARLLTAEEREFLGPHSAEAPRRHYLYSWGLTNYLVFHQNLLSGERLDKYVSADTQHVDPITRFEQLTGQPIAEFEAAWREAMLALK